MEGATAIDVEARIIAMSNMVSRNNLILSEVASKVKDVHASQEALYDAIRNDTFNTKQAAEFLGCCTKTVERAVRSGDLRYTLKETRKYFTRQQLLDYQSLKERNRK